LPEAISFQTAATILLQGLTTQYLATDRDKTLKGETVLIHASAGGIEQFLTQISMLLFATLIGLTTSASKAKIALKNGADNVFLYSEDRKDQILSFSANAVDVLYDSVGNKLSNSFEVTKDCEQVVIFGMAGGEPDFINPRMLTDPSKTLTGGDLWSYLISKEERIKRANQLFDWINNDKITIATPTVFKLSEGEKAHNYLEIRKSTAKVILIP
jgi:NADPH2:quinone reductase